MGFLATFILSFSFSLVTILFYCGQKINLKLECMVISKENSINNEILEVTELETKEYSSS